MVFRVKTRKNIFGLIVLLFTIIFMQGCPPEDIHVSEEDKKKEILLEKIEKVVTTDAVAMLKKLGMPINDGIQPPNVEGSYLVDDITLKAYSNLDDHDPVGTKYDHQKWTLKSQDNSRFSVSLLVEYEEGDPDSYNMIISGNGNRFTLYSEGTKEAKDGNRYRVVNVYSGTMTETGLADVHQAILWIEGTCQNAAFLYHEQDGMAQKFDGPLEPQKPKPKLGEKAGSVKLPQGAKVDFQKYSVVSFSDKQKMTKKGYFVVGIDESEQLQQTVFMVDENNRVLMLSYLNVGEEEIELSAESSAVGIFMMLTGARSQLDKEQWAHAGELLKKTPKFAPVLTEVERLIKEEADLLSENNTRLMELYGELFESLQPFTQSSPRSDIRTLHQTRFDNDGEEDPMASLVITNEANQIIINSNGASPAYQVIIEEEDDNGSRSEVLHQVLGASQAIKFGIGDILTLQVGIFQPPEKSVEYTMKPNTCYRFLALSGVDNPFHSEPHYKKLCDDALLHNLSVAVFYLLDGLGLPLSPTCVKVLVEQNYGSLKALYDVFREEGARDGTKWFINTSLGIIGNINSVECALGKSIEELISKVTKYMLKFLDVNGKFGAYGSLKGHLCFMFDNKSVIEFCRYFDQEYNDVYKCDDDIIRLRLDANQPLYSFKIKTRHNNTKGIWIDWNNNNLKDGGEDQYDSEENCYYTFSGTLHPSRKEIAIYGSGEITEIIALPTECTSVASVKARNSASLMKLTCGGGSLTSVDLRGCNYLKYLDCTYGQLDTDAIKRIIDKLPMRQERDSAIVMFEGNMATPTKEDIEAASAKNWAVAPDKVSGLITLTVKNDPGQYVRGRFMVKSLSAAQALWYDANNNGKCDKGERFVEFAVFTKDLLDRYYTYLNFAREGTFTYPIYGKLSSFVEVGGALSPGKIISIDAPGCPGLTLLRLLNDRSTSELVSLNVSGCQSLISIPQFLDCQKLTSLDVSDCTSLQQLFCANNPLLTSLKVDGCTGLTTIDLVGNTQLKLSLDFSDFELLQRVTCTRNNTTSLDVSGCSELIVLTCRDNGQLTSLNTNGCKKLSEVYIGNNARLTSLDMRDSNLDASEIREIIANLPMRQKEENAIAKFDDNPGKLTVEDVEAAKAKNWTITH